VRLQSRDRKGAVAANPSLGRGSVIYLNVVLSGSVMSSDVAAKEPSRNIRIGKYEVLSHIATGGMGAVYKARDTESGREVALKVLSPELAAKPSMVERFRREARHAAKLNHKNVVTLFEFGEAQNIYYLAMEFIDGIDLFDYSTRKGPLDPTEALKIIRQGCRALDHAYQQGVIHRDIKPSNFLVAQQGEKVIVKMTDFGLAREASNEEFRVTRAGTTIGTLDYMSPEQARDSGLADIRSDLYSLGCTWYHLLAGHAPFPKGGLGERLHRIMNEEPPDVRKCNPRVSAAMAAVVHRLLAKDPAKRYQTPAELMSELDALKHGQAAMTPRQALESLAQESEPAELPTKKSRRSHDDKRTPHSLPSRTRSILNRAKSSAEVATKSGKSTAEVPTEEATENTPPYLWIFLGGAAAIILVVALAVAIIVMQRRGHREKSPATQAPEPVSQNLQTNQPNRPAEKLDVQPPPPVLASRNRDTAKKPSGNVENTIPPKKPTWPALYRPSKPIDVAALRTEIESSWATAPTATPTVNLIVGRLPPDSSDKTFPSLVAACKAIPSGATGIIELRDNGPFFDVPASVADRSLVIRAAKGYQPLLVWDVQRTLDEQRRNRDRPASQPVTPSVFLDVKRGSLTLQDMHLAFKWPDAPSEGAAVLRVEDGDLTVRGCTFSVAGKPREGVTLARFLPMRQGASRCRFERCYARGSKMSVLDADAPGAQVRIESCLFIGDDAPLLQARVANDRPTQFQAVRSTMICGKNLLTLRPAGEADQNPVFDWLGWDVLLSRKTPEFGGELLHLQGNIGAQHLRWRAINCLYAGWGNLLAGTRTIAATDPSAWRRLWERTEGDEVLGDPWPTAVFPESAAVPASTYNTAGSLVAFAASTNPDQPLGCDLEHLPPARDSWLPLTFERYDVQSSALPDNSSPPEIPVAVDGLFHGGRVDLNQTDLGVYLQSVQKSCRLAPEVVLHLSGDGERSMTPLRIKGSNLVLYFEPPSPEKKEPQRSPEYSKPPTEKTEADKKELLALAPGGLASAEALIDVEDGNLSIVNGNFRFSDAGKSRVVPWLIKVRGGDLRLFRTHLEVPPKDSGTAFRGLIALQGSGETVAERIRSCAINESVLVSAHDAIALNGIGARVLLAQTLLIAGDDAIHLALDPDFTQKANGPSGTDVSLVGGKANVQFLLDHATVSARGAVIHMPDVKHTGPPSEPVVLRSHDCGFVNLFGGRTHRPSLVKYEGEALAHGLLIWQSDNDAFDRRLWAGAVCAGRPVPDKPEDHASWMALWGSPGLRRAQLDLQVYRTLDGDRWSVEQKLAGWKAPGANLDKLGLSRKSKSKTPR
jgi:serine/threonine protein kinase